MKKVIAKAIFFLACLAVSMWLFEGALNQGNTDMTAEMSSASFPIAYLKVSGNVVNEMHGYVEEMDASHMRDTLTPIGLDRKLGIKIDVYDNVIRQVSYEIRSSDGSRLIENTPVDTLEEAAGSLSADITIKDLIEKGKEYNFILLLELYNGQVLRYYTKIMTVEDYHVAEKLAYVKRFHENTFSKSTAKDTLLPYLEPDATGDNTSFHKVNIHSTLNQVTWGDLRVQKMTEPVINIREMTEQIASFSMNYQLSVFEDGVPYPYGVEEYYRIRYTADRVYLLGYEREMHRLFVETDEVYNANKISLGIQDPEKVQMMESEGGNIVAFVVGKRLMTYNVEENKMSLLFSYYDNGRADKRAMYNAHEIKLLNVGESGDVQFAVYGYMNRGRHEGQTGLQICMYDAAKNSIEEQAYMRYDKSPMLLIQDLDTVAYAGNQEEFYALLEDCIYEIDLEGKSSKAIVEDLTQDSFRVSEDGEMLAWCVGDNAYTATSLKLMDLKTGYSVDVKAGVGEYIYPLGFMGDDLIYGLADQIRVTRDSNGRVFAPMHTLRIEDQRGNVLKEYHNEGYFVTGVNVEANQITLSRVTLEKSGVYKEAIADQIMNAEAELPGKNQLESIATENLETITQLALKSEVDTASMLFLTPKEVLFEGDNTVVIRSPEKTTKHYYVYSAKGLNGTFSEAGAAVNEAYANAGFVVDDSGACVWYKGNRMQKNQIMKITNAARNQTDNIGQLATCLDVILEFEGINRSTQYMLDSGKTTVEILEENMPDVQVLDLGGCSLDAVLYYVNQDIPVVVSLAEHSSAVVEEMTDASENGEEDADDAGAENGDEAEQTNEDNDMPSQKRMVDEPTMLVIGFNELNVVVMDPTDGSVYKIGMNDATRMFDEKGNKFITYSRNS